MTTGDLLGGEECASENATGRCVSPGKAQAQAQAQAEPKRLPRGLLLTAVRCVRDSLRRRGSGGLSRGQDRGEVPRADFSKAAAQISGNNGQERKTGARRGTSEDESKASRSKGGFGSGDLGGQFGVSSKAGNPAGYWSQSGSRFWTLGIKFALKI
ncbi:hypothetical protein HJG60_011011 [Phyllostomus discolor]|uniref:Uncharacterized protein n=1 Tax=Phyllostomus discolor TaxID=89673 RepID=A0A834AF77_9CHIR|nr:hypothetical protein HJG60_011011 [Phyllostomus discolor]